MKEIIVHVAGKYVIEDVEDYDYIQDVIDNSIDYIWEFDPQFELEDYEVIEE